MSRITLISNFDEDSLSKIESMVQSAPFSMCKVPYGINDESRYEIDNLPYHFTIFATDKKNQDKLVDIVSSIDVEKINLKIDDVKIMRGNYDSFVLYFSTQENEKIKELQRIFYNKIPDERYNPDKFVFHMTLHIDKDEKKIMSLYESIKSCFKPFCVQFDKLALYDYPGEKIQDFYI